MPRGRFVSGFHGFGEFVRPQKFLEFFIGKSILIDISQTPQSRINQTYCLWPFSGIKLILSFKFFLDILMQRCRIVYP